METWIVLGACLIFIAAMVWAELRTKTYDEDEYDEEDE